MFTKLAVVAATLGAVAAQTRPSNTSICDFYTTALFKTNNATTQNTLLTALVNTVVIGNYSPASKGVVPGILAPGTVNGTAVDLLKYFNGSLASTNRGNQGVAVNFLDDGGAAPLKENKPANGTSSNQFNLLTHLYSFFGAALGCTQVGQSGFPAYSGNPSMFEVHKFMALDNAEVTYFIQQVGAAAKSFGVATDDITAVATLLSNTFGQRCTAAAAVIPGTQPSLQAICTQQDCPVGPNGTTGCSAYAAAPSTEPSAASSGSLVTSTGGAPAPSGSAAVTGSPGTGSSKGAAVATAASVGLAMLGAVFVVAL